MNATPDRYHSYKMDCDVNSDRFEMELTVHLGGKHRRTRILEANIKNSKIHIANTIEHNRKKHNLHNVYKFQHRMFAKRKIMLPESTSQEIEHFSILVMRT